MIDLREDDDAAHVTHDRASQSALKLAGIYAAISVLYILLSDELVYRLVHDVELQHNISIVKGWGFILVTAILLFVVVKRQFIRLQEITNQEKRINDERLQAMLLLESIAANSTDAIYAKNLDGRYLLFNQAAANILNMPIASVLGKKDEDILRPEEAAIFRQNDLSVIAGNQTIEVLEQLCTHQGIKTFQSTKAPLLNSAKQIIGVFGISRDISATIKHEEQLKEAQRLLNQMSEMAQIGGWSFDVKTNTGSWTTQIANIHEVEALDDIDIGNVLNVFHGEHRQKIDDALNLAIHHALPYDLELEMITHHGTKKWVRTVGLPVVENGEVERIQGFMQDITNQISTHQQLQMWGKAFESAGFALAIVDANDNKFLAVNPTFAAERGYVPEELVGLSVLQIYPSHLHASLLESIHHFDSNQHGHSVLEVTHMRKDGSCFPVKIDITVIKSEKNQPIMRLVYALDISDKMKAEETIHTLEYFDVLTGLPNRKFLQNMLAQGLPSTLSAKVLPAFMLVNLDHLKHINDARGHAFGDELLKKVAERLHTLLKEGVTLARFGGDEFAVIFPAEYHAENTEQLPFLGLAQQLQQKMCEPYEIGNDEIYITTSCGLTVFPEDKLDTPERILRRADTALHRAKDSGGNQVILFENQMSTSAEEYFQLERELRKAIHANELQVYLQSQVNREGKIVSAEALIRWMHPTRGLVSPATFIPIAESSDLILEIDDWMLTQVCNLLSKHRIAIPEFRLSVNISSKHVEQPTFVDWVTTVIANTGASPHQLTLEITETIVIKNIEDVVNKLKGLNRLGIHFSIDDFGTGYSSLSYLKKLPIHELKIDKVFVQDAPHSQEDAALVETIIAVAKQLNLKLVAEGVETSEQAAFLNDRAEIIHQGFLFGRPEPASQWLKQLS